MWNPYGTDAEDALDRAETKRVLRRAAKELNPLPEPMSRNRTPSSRSIPSSALRAFSDSTMRVSVRPPRKDAQFRPNANRSELSRLFAPGGLLSSITKRPRQTSTIPGPQLKLTPVHTEHGPHSGVFEIDFIHQLAPAQVVTR